MGYDGRVPHPLQTAQHWRLVRPLRSSDFARRTCIVYAAFRWLSRNRSPPTAGENTVRAAQVIFGVTCIFYGISHFAYSEYTASMVPAWLPTRLAFAYFTGLCYIAAGIGIILRILARLAATLVAIMMSLFGLLVWVPSFFAHPKPAWATPPQNQWSELEVKPAARRRGLDRRRFVAHAPLGLGALIEPFIFDRDDLQFSLEIQRAACQQIDDRGNG